MLGLLRIASARAPFRRAGLGWSAKGKAGAIEVDVRDLDGERLLRLLQDPVLTISIGQEDGSFTPCPVMPADFDADHAQMLIDALPSRGEQEFHEAQGAEGRSDAAAANFVAPEAKDDEVKDASSADPLGTAPAAAAGVEESRESTDAGPVAAATPADGEKQPEQSSQAPVAAPNSTDTGRTTGRGSRGRKA